MILMEAFHFGPKEVISGTKIFDVISSTEVRGYLSENKKNEDIIKNKEAHKSLKNLVKDSEITDNPILMVVTLKS